MGTLVVLPVPCLEDNYAYLLRDTDGPDAWVVDPAEASPVQRMLDSHGLVLRGVLATHHHHDHIGGIPALLQRYTGAWVAAHATSKTHFPANAIRVSPDRQAPTDTGQTVAGRPLKALHVPGHTRGSVAWCLADSVDAPSDIFTGDTLFGAGCGRLLEGTAAEMWASLQALTALPGTTRLWFGHEYTAANLRFAATVEPDNDDVHRRISGLSACTTPTTVELERATNPFVRATTPDELADRRRAKDAFQ